MGDSKNSFTCLVWVCSEDFISLYYIIQFHHRNRFTLFFRLNTKKYCMLHSRTTRSGGDVCGGGLECVPGGKGIRDRGGIGEGLWGEAGAVAGNGAGDRSGIKTVGGKGGAGTCSG